MYSSARITFPSLQLRPRSFVKALSILSIFIVVISYSYWSHLANIKGILTNLKPTPAQTQPEKLADHGWTHNIWQTSKYPAENISSENEKYMKTWTDLNPGYQHKLLTDQLIAGYVRDHFHAKNPDIEETFLQAKDFVLQLDLIKYMVLWAEGGVYSDLDVACVQPLKQWVPPQFIDKAGIVLGVQVEQKAGLDGNARESFQLADWTIMSKPNQPFLWFLYQRLTENIKHLAAEEIVPTPDSRPYNISDVTGRNALTQAFLAYTTSVTATKVTVNNFTKMAEPTLFGEILVLPIQAFASSHRNGKEFVHHYETGSWKSEAWDKLQPSVNEEQKKKEPEQKEVAEVNKNVEAEKQKQEQEDTKTTGGDHSSEEDQKVGVSEEEEPSPAGNSTSSADVSTKDKVGQTMVNGTAEPTKPPAGANTASPADEKKPTSDKPTSVQYENAQSKDESITNDKPPSVQYENVKVAENITETKQNTSNSASQLPTNDNTNTKGATDKNKGTKAEEEEEEAENLKAQAAAQALEQEKKDAAAKKAAEANQIAEAQAKEEEKEKEEEKKTKAAEAQKQKEEEEHKLAEEEEEEEEEEKKKLPEPQWAPLNEAGKLVSSNNLADYGSEFVPPD